MSRPKSVTQDRVHHSESSIFPFDPRRHTLVRLHHHPDLHPLSLGYIKQRWVLLPGVWPESPPPHIFTAAAVETPVTKCKIRETRPAREKTCTDPGCRAECSTLKKIDVTSWASPLRQTAAKIAVCQGVIIESTVS